MKYYQWIAAVCALTAGLSGCVTEQQNNTENYLGQQNQEQELNADRPPTAQTLYMMADIQISQGNDKEAEALLARVVRDYPNFLPAYNSLAELRMRSRRIPEAMKSLEAGLKLNPADPVLLNNMGMCWLIRKDFQQALDHFSSAAGIVPENTRYRSNMATALALMGRSDEALALYQQILPKEEAIENIRMLCKEAAVN